MEPRRKFCEEQQDRLGCLPDCILTHILSFLRTSVLSKRYQLLWTLSQCLDFELPVASGNSTALSFMTYVYRVLLLREHRDLFSFGLSLHSCATNGFVENCIDYAAKHKVKHLMLHVCPMDRPLVLPKALITSSFLITLSLSGAFRETMVLPRSVALPNLEELHLYRIEFCETNFSGEIFTGCPRLETLVLIGCQIKPGDQLKSLDVKSPSLVTLKIVVWSSSLRAFDEHTINVNAPKLAFFMLKDSIARVNFVESLPCLSEGRIFLCITFPFNDEIWVERKKQTVESCDKLLRQIRIAKSLYLSRDTVEIISTLRELGLRKDYVFENLKNIKCHEEYDALTIDKIKVA